MTAAIARAAAQDDVSNVRVVLGAASDPSPARRSAGRPHRRRVRAGWRGPVDALKSVAASLAPNGRLGVIDFTKNGAGGPGPPMEERVDPATVVRDATLAGLQVRQTGTRF